VRYEKYQGRDEVLLGPIDLVNKNADLKKKLVCTATPVTGWSAARKISAAGDKGNDGRHGQRQDGPGRQVVDPIGPQVVADLPPFDWSKLGAANSEVVDLHGRNLMMSGLA
jgi:hypothetical protein